MSTTPASPSMRPAWWPPAKPRVTPEEINAARRARETARAAAQAAAQQTRRLVLAIWAVAFTLGIGLAVAAISS